MSLTFTKKYGMRLPGGKQYRCYDITHDDSTTTISAGDIDLHSIDHFEFSMGSLTSAPAATFTMSHTATASVSCIIMSEALKTGSITRLTAIGT